MRVRRVVPGVLGVAVVPALRAATEDGEREEQSNGGPGGDLH